MILPTHLIFYQSPHEWAVIGVQSSHQSERFELEGEPEHWIALEHGAMVTRLLINVDELPLIESRDDRFKSVLSFYQVDTRPEVDDACRVLLPQDDAD